MDTNNYDINEFDIEILIKDFNALTLNGVIENMRLVKKLQDKSDGYAVGIILDDIENLSYDIMTLISNKDMVMYEQLEVDKYSMVTNEEITLIRFMIGGNMFVENIDYIQEIVTLDANKLDEAGSSSTNNKLNLRGLEIPIINLYEKWHLQRIETGLLEGQTLVIINTKWNEEVNKYAVRVDPFTKYSVFASRFGISSQCCSKLYGKFARECWDCAEDKQAVFLDWNKIFKN